MKKNTLFLVIGLLLSVISKLLQFVYSSKIGDLIVIFAAVFLVLAILYTIPPYVKLVHEDKKLANRQAIYSCLSVFSFQVMMIQVIGNKQNIGFVFMIPFIIFTGLVIQFWVKRQVEKKG
ncbi:MAG TPA: hypothetical protein DCY20_00160 [Firmicutes bacterium]|nr:hypothetical protein [Bacillota bacterium]